MVGSAHEGHMECRGASPMEGIGVAISAYEGHMEGFGSGKVARRRARTCGSGSRDGGP